MRFDDQARLQVEAHIIRRIGEHDFDMAESMFSWGLLLNLHDDRLEGRTSTCLPGKPETLNLYFKDGREVNIDMPKLHPVSYAIKVANFLRHVQAVIEGRQEPNVYGASPASPKREPLISNAEIMRSMEGVPQELKPAAAISTICDAIAFGGERKRRAVPIANDVRKMEEAWRRQNPELAGAADALLATEAEGVREVDKEPGHG